MMNANPAAPPHLDDLLRAAVDQGASDLHITAEMPPVVRVNGQLVTSSMPKLSYQQCAELLDDVLNDQQRSRFAERGEVDLSYSVPGLGRFRVNGYRQRGAVGIALRVIPNQPKPLAALGLPEVIAGLARKANGLVLVTGPTGSGKSTTLASMVDLINNERACHVMTIEDPIEFLHRHRRSIVNQREVGSDTHSFANALRAAMRQDPDVILVGEMRDLETTQTAISAAETGHLVLATLHSSDAPQTIERLIDIFPPHQQQQIRIQLAECLQGVVSQQLIPRADKPGRVVAVEVMTATPAVRNLIREGKTHQLYSSIQTGGKYGMQSMDNSLRQLYQQGLISSEEYNGRITDAEKMSRSLSG
ncbi:MAG: type IV pilus twitching motility protein PilT [Bacillota bacterium]